MKANVANGHNSPVRNLTDATLTMYIGKQRLYWLVINDAVVSVRVNLLDGGVLLHAASKTSLFHDVQSGLTDNRWLALEPISFHATDLISDFPACP